MEKLKNEFETNFFENSLQRVQEDNYRNVIMKKAKSTITFNYTYRQRKNQNFRLEEIVIQGQVLKQKIIDILIEKFHGSMFEKFICGVCISTCLTFLG